MDDIRIHFERGAGFLVLALMALFATAVSVGAGGVGLDSRSENFFADGPESWRIVATERRSDLTDGLIPLAIAGALSIGAGAVLLGVRNPHHSGLRTAGTFGLIGSGALILAFSGLNYWIADLASRWAASASPTQTKEIADTAFTAVTARFMVGLLGLPLLMGSLLVFGIFIQKITRLPKWLTAFPVVGGLALLISPVGFAVGGGFFLFVTASGGIIAIWLAVLCGRVIVWGTD